MCRVRIASLVVSVLVGIASAGCGADQSGIRRPFGTELIAQTDTSFHGEWDALVGIVRTSTGDVITADRGRYEVRWHGTDGSSVALGRKGRGPGEFRSLHRIEYCGADSVVAYDFQLSRLHIYAARAFVRQLQLPPRLVASEFVGCAGLDSLFFAVSPSDIAGFGAQRNPVTLSRFNTQTGTVDWISTLKGTDVFVSERRSAMFDVPFGERTMVGASLGSVVYAYANQAAAFLVESDGSIRSLMVRDLVGGASRNVTRGDKELYLREQLALFTDSSTRMDFRAVMDEVEWGRKRPIIDRLLTSRDGYVWLRRAPLSTDTLATWFVVRFGDGEIRWINMPIQARVMFADQVGAITLTEDEAGKQSIALIDLRRRTP